MAENGKENPQPPAPPEPPVATNLGPNAASMKCTTCTKDMNVRLPTPRIINQIDVSILVFVHEKLDKCPHCGTLFLIQIGGIDGEGHLQLKWVKIIPRQEEQTILAPTTQNMKTAMMSDQIAKGVKKQ